ncbi:MAG: helix-turn-helix transcriptional regulator [Betaproteobacteria bacterium]|nr:helix-turn-helix transcriptional regulator [Betaproteobacteria bacterium]
MKRIAVKPTWILEDETGQRVGPEVFALLAAINGSRKLTEAAEAVGVSYRHAWGLVETWGEFFGQPLVRFERGKGTSLTPLGEKILWAEQRAIARMGLQLESLASEINLEINQLLDSALATVRIHASHGFAVARVPALLQDHPRIRLDLRYLGTLESLASLVRGACDLAGFHVPVGELGASAARQYLRWLRPEEHRIVHLVTRTQGLFLAAGNPRNIRGLDDLTRPNVQFVNRQKGSGTRLLFDQLLAAAGIEGDQIRGYRTEEFTHAAVAAYVGSGIADAGFGVQPAAHNLRLDFVPIAREHYFFAVALTTLERPEIQEFLSLLKGETFQQMVRELPGYEAPKAGEVSTLGEAFREGRKAKR